MFAIFRISTFTPTTRSWTGSAAPHPSASLRSASAMMRCVGSGCPVRRGAVRGSQTSKQLPRSLLALHHLGSNSGRHRSEGCAARRRPRRLSAVPGRENRYTELFTGLVQSPLRRSPSLHSALRQRRIATRKFDTRTRDQASHPLIADVSCPLHRPRRQPATVNGVVPCPVKRKRDCSLQRHTC